MAREKKQILTISKSHNLMLDAQCFTVNNLKKMAKYSIFISAVSIPLTLPQFPGLKQS